MRPPQPPKKPTFLTLQEAASGMHPKWQGGADSAPPHKNQFRGHFDPNFSHNLDRVKKSLEKFLNFGPLPLLGLRKITF